MRIRKMFILSCMIALSTASYAQRYDDVRSANLSAGILTNGFQVSLGLEFFKGKTSAFVGELDYLSKREKLKTHDIKAHYTNYLLGVKYRKYFIYSGVYPYVSLGLFGGYEVFSNKNSMPQSVIIDRQDAFIYGISPDIGIEYPLRHVSLFGAFKPRYDLYNKEFLTSIDLGVKYYF